MVENMEGEVIEEEDEFINIRKTYLKKKLASKKTELYEVDSLQFSILSSEDILKLSETRICNKELYFPMTQNPMPFGVLDDRLGASKGRGVCKTCGRSFQDCCGHWGHVTLHQPVLHVGYFKHLINLLYCVCKTCSRLLLSEEDKKKFLLRSRRCHDAMQRKILLKTLVIKCKRENFCLHPDCRAPQGVLRRVMKPSLDQFMKIVLQKKVRKDGAGSAASRTTVCCNI
jgi:DNA-directed RNA polymerase III subunit RPC1